MGIAIVVIVILLVIFLAAAIFFLNMVLQGRPDRKERMQVALPCEDQAGDNPGQQTFVANRTRLRAEGAEFDKTMVPVELTNRTGMKLYGRYRLRPTEENCHDWVISVHGYKDDHRFMLPYVMRFYDRGLNVFTQDNRAHGLSDGKYISMGWHDKDDVYEWIDYIVSMDPQARVIVHGVSMGAATTMMLSGRNHPAVVGYVEDCGYTSVWDIFETVMNRDYHLPAFPIMHICSILSNILLKYDYKKSSSLDQLLKCNNKPIFFIHGEKDNFVPLWMGQKCYETYKGPKDIYIAPGAGHAESMDWYPDVYFEKFFAFVDTYCKG